MLSDIEIANAAKPDKISNVAKNLGLGEDEICLLYTSDAADEL